MKSTRRRALAAAVLLVPCFALAGGVEELEKAWTTVIMAANKAASITDEKPVVKVLPDGLEIIVTYKSAIAQGMPVIMIPVCATSAALAERAEIDLSLWALRLSAIDTTGNRRDAQLRMTDCSAAWTLMQAGDNEAAAKQIITTLTVR